MQKYIALFFSVSLSLFACNGNKAPGEVLNPQRMSSLLTDVHILDGRMYTMVQNPDTMYKYGTGRYIALFKKYGTDSTQFINSLKYYASKPAQLLPIYDTVLATLKRRSDSLNKLQAIENRKTDAINTLKNKRINDSIQRVMKHTPLQKINSQRNKPFKNVAPQK
jgi:hypothetical protein